MPLILLLQYAQAPGEVTARAIRGLRLRRSCDPNNQGLEPCSAQPGGARLGKANLDLATAPRAFLDYLTEALYSTMRHSLDTV